MLEVFYTGGGIWLAEINLNETIYGVVSSEAPEYFTVYKYCEDGEKYLPEDMVESKHKSELDSLQIIVYERLVKELKKAL